MRQARMLKAFKVILNSSASILPAPDPHALHNANDPEAYREAIQSLGS